MPKRKYLFYIAHNYCFEILRPLQRQIRQVGDDVAWFCQGREITQHFFTDDEKVYHTVEQVINYHPDACFVPGNLIPHFIPGLKVQVFHGLEWKKKGHFVIRECFDLYCTHGKATTTRFLELAAEHQYFDVVETGWPKLDTLFTSRGKQFFSNNKPTILYAPTFSPALTSATKLLTEIKRLLATNEFNWLIKFHPKMNPEYINQYQQISSQQLKIIDGESINQLLQSADIMVSDTSSVIGEFSLLGKPVVSLNNSAPGDYLVNIQNPAELYSAIKAAMNPSKQLLAAIQGYANELHPYQDGCSSQRVLDAVEQVLQNGKKAKKSLPRNIFRNLKLRKKLHYWWCWRKP